MDKSLEFRVKMAKELAQRALVQVRPFIKSRTLARTMEVLVQDRDGVITGVVHSPFYWARYYHDGRGAIYADPGKPLMYFPHIEDDPRVSGGRRYPVRAADIVRLTLTRTEIRGLVAEGKLRVRRSVGPAPPHPFFKKGLRTFHRVASRVVPPAFSQFVRRELGPLLKIRGTLLL